MRSDRDGGGKTVYIIGTNHFDPIWRRGFKKPFTWDDEIYVGDEKIQEACIDDWLAICRDDPEVVFEIECTLVLRNYLEKHPDKLPVFRELARNERFELRASGEVIPDTNMPSGETLVRNLALGLLWGEETLGVPAVTGCLNDAFGSSSQLPQIFKGCGIDIVMGLSYSLMDGKFWRGLDGTVIRVANNIFGADQGKPMGKGTYYKPCPLCKGRGCEGCQGRAFDQGFRMTGEPDLEGLNVSDHPFCMICVGGEETMAPLDLAERVGRARKRGDGAVYKYGLFKTVVREHYGDLNFSGDESEVSTKAEANPAQTASYTSRIKVKQNLRRIEYQTLGLEKLAAVGRLNGITYPAGVFKEQWRDISLAAFHDCVTGTHIDAGYDELMEMYARCDGRLKRSSDALWEELTMERADSVTVFNPHAFPVSDYIDVGEGNYVRADNVPPMGFRTVRLPAVTGKPVFQDMTGAGRIENDYYRILFDKHGITGIHDKELGRDLIRANAGYANELILERDVGDPYSTREACRPRTRLGSMGDVLSAGRRGCPGVGVICMKGRFRSNENFLTDPADYRVFVLEWEQEVVLFDGVKRVDFKTSVNWSAFDRRIRVSFPTNTTTDDGYYAVPYGVLKRRRYERTDLASVCAPEGDWACVEWFSTAEPHDVNVALMNRGTPASRIERGEMMISLLRSPSFPGGGLYSPEFYDAPVYQGMRDHGRHTFMYAMTSFDGEWADSAAPRMAYQYNGGLIGLEGELKRPLDTVGVNAASTEIGSCKMAEDGNGLIIRLNEYKGRHDTAKLHVPRVRKAFETNLLEKTLRELPVTGGSVDIGMEPFKIKTIRVLPQ